MMQHLSLLELNGLVRDVIETTLSEEYWVEAELASVREVKGHCYMELVQKDRRSHTPVAQASAKCWRTAWSLLGPHFERVTGQSLRAGMKVLLKVVANFHEAYGFSWIVTDLNAEYTMGDMARRRAEIIQTLKDEGVFDMQKQLELPLCCQRIAVVSSAGAAGYGDFCRQLLDNEHGLHFMPTLFPAVMQGEQVEQSVISALNAIASASDDYDVVVIIRGGGATSDLSGFDTLRLAENVCNFPLPILTGIGHERDESILDLVAYHSVKTPTAAAAFLIDHQWRLLAFLDDAEQSIVRLTSARLAEELSHLTHLSTLLRSNAMLLHSRRTQQLERAMASVVPNTIRLLTQKRQTLDVLLKTLPARVDLTLGRQAARLEQLALRVKHADPSLLLSRGYSITTHEGRIVKDASLLKSGDVIETRVARGRVKSVVK